MPLERLAGKHVLEIGPGGGAHSCLFAKFGAQVTAPDITPPRAASTNRKLKLVGDGSGMAYQGDGENLPSRTPVLTSSIPTACCIIPKIPSAASPKCYAC